jgi:hypothetical protein
VKVRPKAGSTADPSCIAPLDVVVSISMNENRSTFKKLLLSLLLMKPKTAIITKPVRPLSGFDGDDKIAKVPDLGHEVSPEKEHGLSMEKNMNTGSK